jgi:hypothetical protein
MAAPKKKMGFLQRMTSSSTSSAPHKEKDKEKEKDKDKDRDSRDAANKYNKDKAPGVPIAVPIAGTGATPGSPPGPQQRKEMGLLQAGGGGGDKTRSVSPLGAMLSRNKPVPKPGSSLEDQVVLFSFEIFFNLIIHPLLFATTNSCPDGAHASQRPRQ